MIVRLRSSTWRLPVLVLSALAWQWGQSLADANPTGGSVSQGSASFNSSGSQLTINQTSANAFINWNSFNIGAGETTTFNQPSSSSVTWNYINDPSASSLNGNLNANGYVILQNPNGFTVGGSAIINTHGLVMTTASTPGLDLSGGGSWAFDAPPPTAKIVNYGQINIAGGGSAYLIASDIENNGTISAPGGKIGLYAGETVLVSTSPDGRGLSAAVTLPQGSVDNEGKLIADAGSIAMQAKTVNQGGLIQANSVQDVNGTIELVASDSVNLGSGSVISAQGDSTGVSSGGTVTIKSDNAFSDQAGSTINISGGAQGGNGGQAEISALQMSAINSTINGQAADGYVNGVLTIDPYNILLASSSSDLNAQYSGTVNPNDPPTSTGSTLTLNVNSFASTLSQINLQALNNIELSTIWTLADQSAPAMLSLTAGNNITLDDGSGISAGNNWSVNLTAGTSFSGATKPASGSDGIYLNGSAYLQTQNGGLNLNAANEVICGGGAIRTIGGGSIDVTAVNGDVNSGTSSVGYDYLTSAPYYAPDSNLGGISTAAGGNVTINAGGNVISYATTPSPTEPVSAGDPGTGAFGPEAGNVTINAGGNVYGNFVVANGAGAIKAGQNIGTSDQNVALSLVKGSWNLDAQNNLYLQEVRNPNGVFDNQTVLQYNPKTHKFTSTPTAGNHLFNYDPLASVTLTAGDSVNLTGYNLPRPNGAVPMLLPPTLIINAGAGGVTLQTPNFIDVHGQNISWTGNQSESDITLFPSAYGNLQITTIGGGGLSSGNVAGNAATLLMSDSSVTQWYPVPDGYNGPALFGPYDHASTPAELQNENPVVLNISGSMDNIILQVSKLAQITVGGNMTGCSFFGENLNAKDVTSITVGGQIYYAGSFSSVTLAQAFPDILQLSATLLPAGDSFLPSGTADSWFTMLQLAVVDPSIINSQTYSYSQDLNAILASQYREYPALNLSNLEYNSVTKKLTLTGPLSYLADSAQTPDTLYKILESGTLNLVVYGPNGLPLLDSNGHFVIKQVNWLAPNTPAYADISGIDSLNTQSQGKPPLGSNGALIVGGTGEFDVTANSINLGNSDGILSVGNGGTPAAPFLGDVSYSFLTPYITSGATINVIANSLEMPSSTIAALGGGDVNVRCNGMIPGSPVNSSGVGVSMDLGSQDLVDFEAEIMNASNLGLGIYTTGGGNVNVTALGTVNIDSSRIATFNGGNVNITSLTGDVNAGSGGTIAIPINTFPLTATLPTPFEYAYANGIVADTLALEPNGSSVPGAATLPGNITVLTPQGSIYADVGGILQESLTGTLPAGPFITLEAGTPNPPGDWNSKLPPLYGPPPGVADNYVGDISLGNSGAIGGTVNVNATGKVTGLLISSQNANVTSQSVGSLTVLSGGTATVFTQGSSGGGITIIGAQGVNASGIGSGATVLGQNVSVNGAAATSTLGSSASATGTSTAAAGVASSEAQQQIAGTDNGDDDQKKKKKPELRKVSRVTVILSSAVPPQ
jgi:filamentous hemagglutinin family protein